MSWNAVSCFCQLTFSPKKDVLRETVLVTRSQLPDIPDTLKYRTLHLLFKISQFQLVVTNTLNLKHKDFCQHIITPYYRSVVVSLDVTVLHNNYHKRGKKEKLLL